MGLEEIIRELMNAPKANRKLDEVIAILAGYTRVFERVQGEGGAEESKVLWVPPGSSKKVPLPGFTNSIDIARNFIEIISPKSVVGCSWEEGAGHAKVDDNPYCSAATPSLALCIAGVRILLERRDKKALSQ